MKDAKTEQEFDIKFFLQVFVKFWYIILTATVLFGALAGGYKAYKTEPVYIARVSFWVESASGTMGASQMAMGYVELINSGPKELWDRANTYRSDKDPSEPDLNEKWGTSINDIYSALGSMVSAYKSSEDSNMFTLEVSSSNRERTYDAIFCLQYVTESVIEKISGVSNVVRVNEVFDSSDISVKTDSLVKYAVIGAIFGFVTSYVLCFCLYIYRKKIDGLDMLDDAGIAPIIGVVPMAVSEHANADGEAASVIPYETRESFNLLRASLTAEGGGGVYAIMPVSKSLSAAFIATGLALSFAEAGLGVTVVSSSESGIDAEGPVSKTISSENGYISGTAVAAAVEECRKVGSYVLVCLPSHSLVEDINAVSRSADGFILTVGMGDRLDSVKKTVAHIESAKGNTLGICYTE